MHPKDYFKIKNQRLSNAGHCFVVMPFAPEFDNVYSAVKKALGAPDLEFSCIRGDELLGGGDIMESVLHEMERAEIIIADLTGGNANVFYELGIAHTIKDQKSVLLISQAIDKLPFDVQLYRCIRYDQLEVLTKELIETIKEMTPTRKLIQLKRGELWKAPESLGEDNLSYSFEFRLVRVADNGVVINLEVFQETEEKRERVEINDHPLRLYEHVKIPRILRALKLDRFNTELAEAEFCVCDPYSPRT